MVAVKICGLKDEVSLKAAIDSGADYLGFMFFAKSTRNISPEKSSELARTIPDSIYKVAVTVNPDDALLTQIINNLNPDYIQLHGDESPQRVAEIKQKFHCKIIKAVAVRTAEDITASQSYSNIADILLFDAKAHDDAEFSGGQGISFDWNILAGFKSNTKWMLSGGLNSGNIAAAINRTGAHMVDVSSGVEREKGVKDSQLIAEFIHTAKQI